MDFAATIDEQLIAAQAAFDSLSDTSIRENTRLVWLERQLAHIIAQLHGLKEDVDCGWLMSGEGGIFSDGEFEEILNDLAVSIANLKGLIQTAKIICR